MLPHYSQLHTCGGLGTVHFSVGRRTRPLGSSAFSCFICFIQICDPTFIYFKFIRLRSTSAHFQTFPTNSDTRAAQHTAEPQQDPRPFPAFVTAIARHPHHHQRRQKPCHGLKRSLTSSSRCHCTSRPRHTQTCTVPAPAFTNTPDMRPRVDP